MANKVDLVRSRLITSTGKYITIIIIIRYAFGSSAVDGKMCLVTNISKDQ